MIPVDSTTTSHLAAQSVNNPICPSIKFDTPGVYMGSAIEWGQATPKIYNEQLGRNAAVFHLFANIGVRGIEDRGWINYVVNQVKQANAVLLLTLEPWQELSSICSSVICNIVEFMNHINSQGVFVLLRFAHEMNGKWYPWGQRPTEFVKIFRKVAKAVKENTVNVSIVWSVNTGTGYPWTTAKIVEDNSCHIEVLAMDTNGDGIVNHLDDPYSPYWPGEEYVDWVGIDTYHFGDIENAANAESLPQAFNQSIGTLVSATEMTFSVYEKFAKRYNKPFGVFETVRMINHPYQYCTTLSYVVHELTVHFESACYYPDDTKQNVSEMSVKKSWWQQMLADDIPTRYPLLKLICWFEFFKKETSGSQIVWRDFKLLNNPQVAKAFRADLPKWALFAEDLN